MKQRIKSSARRNPAAAMAGCVLLGGGMGSLIWLWPEWAERLRFSQETLARVMAPEAVLLLALVAAAWLRQGKAVVLAALTGKGLLLSLQVAAPMAQLGSRGYAQAVCLGLIPGFFTLTAMLLLGRQSLLLAEARRGRAARRRGGGADLAFFVTAAVGAVTVALAACMRVWLLPPLWTLAEGLLFP